MNPRRLASSPPARGSSADGPRRQPVPSVVPASAGVFLPGGWSTPPGRRRPRQRGGLPPPPWPAGSPGPSSPPARGSSVEAALAAGVSLVVPASAGVFPSADIRLRRSMRRPRQRGGLPVLPRLPNAPDELSPPARGSSLPGADAGTIGSVVPASAGVFRWADGLNLRSLRRPRQRGGLPHGAVAVAAAALSSPPARGSSLRVIVPGTSHPVVPASAGVFPNIIAALICAARRPRQRGGLPAGRPGGPSAPRSSPPARGSSAHRPVRRLR